VPPRFVAQRPRFLIHQNLILQKSGFYLFGRSLQLAAAALAQKCAEKSILIFSDRLADCFL